MAKKPKLKLSDRLEIKILLDKGYSYRAIARSMGRSPNTISYEVAQMKANMKRSNSKYQGMRIEQNPVLKNHIISELKAHRSPDEIAGRMRTEGRSPSVQTAAIYRWLYSSKRACTTVSVVVVVKRKTKYISGNKVPSLESRHITESIRRIQGERPSDALIFDRGIENREHEKFGVPVYFCDPHAPHQKPLVEGSVKELLP